MAAVHSAAVVAVAVEEAAKVMVAYLAASEPRAVAEEVAAEGVAERRVGVAKLVASAAAEEDAGGASASCLLLSFAACEARRRSRARCCSLA